MDDYMIAFLKKSALMMLGFIVVGAGIAMILGGPLAWGIGVGFGFVAGMIGAIAFTAYERVKQAAEVRAKEAAEAADVPQTDTASSSSSSRFSFLVNIWRRIAQVNSSKKAEQASEEAGAEQTAAGLNPTVLPASSSSFGFLAKLAKWFKRAKVNSPAKTEEAGAEQTEAGLNPAVLQASSSSFGFLAKLAKWFKPAKVNSPAKTEEVVKPKVAFDPQAAGISKAKGTLLEFLQGTFEKQATAKQAEQEQKAKQLANTPAPGVSAKVAAKQATLITYGIFANTFGLPKSELRPSAKASNAPALVNV